MNKMIKLAANKSKKMNIQIIIYIGIIICAISCKSTPKENPAKNQIEHSDTASQDVLVSPDYEEKIELTSIDFENRIKGMITQDSTISLISNIIKDHRIFGYEAPSIQSKKLFLLSVFTNEVKGNPFNCPYGSYYETLGMTQEGITLKYISDTLDFKRIAIIRHGSIKDYSYVQEKWLSKQN